MLPWVVTGVFGVIIVAEGQFCCGGKWCDRKFKLRFQRAEVFRNGFIEEAVVDKTRILIVDDVVQNVQFLGTLLQDQGFLISIAQDGAGGLRAARQLMPDLILLDIMMPGMDGYETCQQLKQNDRTKDIPVIFLTALSGIVDMVKGFRAGAVDYITKPIEAEELLARVNTHLTLKRLRSELQEKNIELKEHRNNLAELVQQKTKSLLAEIKERKRVEGELRDTKNYLDSILNSIPSALIGVNRNNSIVHWNRRAEKLFSLKSDKARDKNLYDIVPLLIEYDNTVSGVSVSRKCEFFYKQNIVYGSDALYDLLFYPLVDEVNNALAGVLQSTQIIKGRLFGHIKENIQVAEELGLDLDVLGQYLTRRRLLAVFEQLVSSGEMAGKIVSSMLEFSRKSQSEKQVCSVHDIIEDSIRIAALYTPKKKFDFRQIEIIRDYSSDSGDVLCVRLEIQQVILNLLKNGAEAMSEKISDGYFPEFRIRTYNQDNSFFLEVEDNGPGIDMEQCRRIFDPFYTTKEVGVGTGLGLSVSMHLIRDNHGGSIEVDSVFGEHTKFKIGLPLKGDDSPL